MDSAPTVKPGDAVNFVNAGKTIPAVVRNVQESGHADIEYLAYHDEPANPGKILANGIPWCPPGGSHGWQTVEAPEAAASTTDAPSAEGAGTATAGASADAGDAAPKA